MVWFIALFRAEIRGALARMRSMKGFGMEMTLDIDSRLAAAEAAASSLAVQAVSMPEAREHVGTDPDDAVRRAYRDVITECLNLLKRHGETVVGILGFVDSLKDRPEFEDVWPPISSLRVVYDQVRRNPGAITSGQAEQFVALAEEVAGAVRQKR
ncbi:MAG: hypothetical protein IE926_12345 [Micrococcales bacterium]|nr:hypothetical protein [Micrococcales bacterium]